MKQPERIHRPYMLERWFSLLEMAVDAHPRSRAGVADELGFKRPTISQVMSGNYGVSPGRPEGSSVDKIARAVIDHYDHPDCPLVERVIARPLCRKTALRDQPRGGDALARWNVCQTCAHKPDKET